MSSFFKDKTVVVTGRMHKSRAAIESELQSAGAKVVRSVRRGVDYLICGENVGETKMAAAAACGVARVTAWEYVRLTSDTNFAILDELAATATTLTRPLSRDEIVAAMPETYGGW